MSQILTVTASLAPSWSFLSRLWGSLTVVQWAAVVATAILTFGAVLEYWAKIKLLTVLLLKYLLGRSTPFDRCVFRKVFVHSLGPILVVVGIAGEVVFEGRAFILEDRQEEQNWKIVGSLSDKAEAADAKAQSAIDNSYLADIRADALNLRLDAASSQLGQLEKKLAAQGPRDKLLIKAAPELASKLAPFAGQRVSLFVCGDHSSADQETFDTWAAIANILDKGTVSGITGANWKLVPTNLNFVTVGCGAAKDLGQGVMAFVSKAASRRTMEAANALGHGIANALPPSSNKMPSLIDPTFSKLLVDRGLQDKNLPWISVGLDPDLITVLIGAHP